MCVGVGPGACRHPAPASDLQAQADHRRKDNRHRGAKKLRRGTKMTLRSPARRMPSRKALLCIWRPTTCHTTMGLGKKRNARADDPVAARVRCAGAERPAYGVGVYSMCHIMGIILLAATIIAGPRLPACPLRADSHVESISQFAGSSSRPLTSKPCVEQCHDTPWRHLGTGLTPRRYSSTFGFSLCLTLCRRTASCILAIPYVAASFVGSILAASP